MRCTNLLLRQCMNPTSSLTTRYTGTQRSTLGTILRVVDPAPRGGKTVSDGSDHMIGMPIACTLIVDPLLMSQCQLNSKARAAVPVDDCRNCRP